MTMMRGDPADSDLELLYVHALDESKIHYMVSHRVWKSFTAAYGSHYHLFYEVLIHKRNGTVLNVGPNSYEMVPYSFYVIAPYQLHQMVCDEALHDYERICIYVSEEQLNRCGMGIMQMRELMNGMRTQYMLLPEEYDEIERMSHAFHRRSMQDVLDACDELEDAATLTGILARLCRAIMRQSPEQGESGANPLIRQVVGYLVSHCAEPLTLDSVASAFNVNKYYLSHLFSKVTGTSVYQYLLVCRVDAAKKMIVAGESVTDTAYRCGFNDYSSFLRAFQKITGKSPRKFQKDVKNP